MPQPRTLNISPPKAGLASPQYEPNEVLSQKPLEGSHELSLADAIALGLRFNLDVQIERFYAADRGTGSRGGLGRL